MILQRTQRAIFVLLAVLGLFGLAQALLPQPATAAPARSAVITEYRQRLKLLNRQIPDITRSAETVAARWAGSEKTLLHLVYRVDCLDFTSELWSRAGGFDNFGSTDIRKEQWSPSDVFVGGPRSWEKGAETLKPQLALAKKNGWMTIVFGSKAGMPADLPIDVLIDNGAKDGSENGAAMNQLINSTAGWLWSCELTAALTRKGKAPAILKGMMLPGATEHNKTYQHNAPTLYPCDTAIPAGKLSKIYLKAIDKELADLESAASRKQIAQAAKFAVEHLNAGHAVWSISPTHILNGEVAWNLKSPMQGFIIPDEGWEQTVTKNVKPGDLLFFFGEWSLNLPWTDYLGFMRKAEFDYIPSYRTPIEPMEPFPGAAVDSYDFNAPDALMVLEQHWPFENAAAPIPFAPGKMAPVSGIYVGLQFRMLDEAIVNELARQKTAEQ